MSLTKKASFILAILLLLLLAFSGCNSATTVEDIFFGDDIAILEGVTADYENMFFDDFTNGVNYDDWYIGKQAWGANENGGVIPQNVNYTDQGVLVFSGNGNYYTDGEVNGVGGVKDGRLTGGALISKFLTGPGRYEIKMKVLPRLGACSAFWTYAYEPSNGNGDDANHEIDIELPGGKGTLDKLQTFENVLNTNYITVGNNISHDTKIADAAGSDNVIALNDGQWHTFGFDWYTNPQKVVYYVDGKVTAVSNNFVPSVQARLWLGVWFPNTPGFVGDANFESDVMQVDYVMYLPFADQPFTPFNPTISNSQVALRSEYPTTPVSVSKTNKIANGNFEYVANTQDSFNYGWQSTGVRILSNEELATIRENVTQEVTQQNPDLEQTELKKLINQKVKEIQNQLYKTNPKSLCYLTKGIGIDDTCGVKVTNIGRLYQEIDAVYQGFQLDLSFVAKGGGKVMVEFYGRGSEKAIESKVFTVNSTSWQTFSQIMTAPKGSTKVNIIVQTDNYDGGEIFADNFVLHIN